jgi:hypothetical protein
MALTDQEIRAARERGRKLREETSWAVTARYDRRASRVVVALANGLELSFSPEQAQGLEDASTADLSVIEISPSGLGLHWPKLDADLYVPALLQGVFGSKKWMAQRMGESGGRSRSRAKTAAARENGKRGGRPKKTEKA